MVRLLDPTSAFIRDAFAEYYQHFQAPAPTSIQKREFAFATLAERMMLRHKSFKTAELLKEYLASLVPSDVYYSCAYYDDPEAEMDKKGWLGSDLIFDIDADHIQTSCGKIHDEWVCMECDLRGKGLVPDRCPACGGQKFNVKTWPCEDCLGSARSEAIKLLDVLSNDFGFPETEMHAFFSGHRGYHVHVESEIIRELDSGARKEIVDYICGLGLDTSIFGLDESFGRGKQASKRSRLGDQGWHRRIAKTMRDLVLNASCEDYENLGVGKNVVGTIMKNKGEILRGWNSDAPYPIVRGIGLETWRKLFKYSVSSASAEIDTVVTTDTHRLIRLAGALHGKTGFKKIEFPVSKIIDFDPFKTAVAFKKGTVSIFVSNAPRFRIGDEAFGPYKDQKVELPTAAAVLLICRNRAEVVERDVRRAI